MMNNNLRASDVLQRLFAESLTARPTTGHSTTKSPRPMPWVSPWRTVAVQATDSPRSAPGWGCRLPGRRNLLPETKPAPL